jgi:hypothetical protein
MATNKPVTITPKSIAPKDDSADDGPAIESTNRNSTMGESTGKSDGMIISRIAARVSMSTARP